MATKAAQLQDPFLNILRKERIPVAIFLMNGIKLQGRIDSFDQFVILLKSSVNQMIYKHAISTIVPAKAVSILHDSDGDDSGGDSDGNSNGDSDGNGDAATEDEPSS